MLLYQCQFSGELNRWAYDQAEQAGCRHGLQVCVCPEEGIALVERRRKFFGIRLASKPITKWKRVKLPHPVVQCGYKPHEDPDHWDYFADARIPTGGYPLWDFAKE